MNKDLKKRYIKEDIRFVDLKYCTLIGTLNHITIPIDRFDEILRDGVGVDGSSLPGYKGVQKAELEFYIFDKFDFKEGIDYIYYKIGLEKSNYPIRFKGGYHIGMPEDHFAGLRNEMVQYLKSCGIRVKYHHHEVGSKGQMEIELLSEPLLKAADNIFLAEYILKCVARKYNKYLTFMPKPFFGEPGNGMHLHQYLGSKNRSLFYDPKGKDLLSDLCLKFIGGILVHSRALCAFTNPSTNSYKRLIPGFEAPTYADFALGSRTSAIRVPGYIRNKKELDIEYRIPDATSNPYLALSAVLLAGLDGIENHIKPDKKEKLPTNSYEAINALIQDHKYLLKGDVFNEDLIERWIEVKTKEFEDVHLRPHPYEFFLYLRA